MRVIRVYERELVVVAREGRVYGRAGYPRVWACGLSTCVGVRVACGGVVRPG